MTLVADGFSGKEKEGVSMARRNRQTFKKREREMARKQKKLDKAQRMAERKAARGSAPVEELPPLGTHPDDLSSSDASAFLSVQPADKT